MTSHLIATLPGDGIGPEVMDEARKVAAAAAAAFGFELKWRNFPFGAAYFLEHKIVLPPSALDDLAEAEALLLGAVGDPRVEPGPLEQELLLAIRFHFDQYLNLRPALSFPGVPTPTPLPKGRRLNAMVVRENTEDFYMGLGGQGHGRLENEFHTRRNLYNLDGHLTLHLNPKRLAAVSVGLMTHPAVARITYKAGQLARSRGETRLTVATKANAVPQLYGFWNEITRETLAAKFPELRPDYQNVDALCYLLPRQPTDFGVILCPNLFGDIISDLLSALAGGLGLAASGNIGDSLSMFEPVHGSAPALVGTGRANPIAAILSAAMMFHHLGETAAAEAINEAVTTYLTGASRPFELGGNDSTAASGDLIAAHLANL
ncbi:MAG: isocitrate/isopropylmalate dehydrogenase family protein [Candidatus Adiutrix intracellularis]|jgi:3-isopropylmalate dehydrogenase|nr:isocitrate/isopropylmalate dehydrogenase family protein [Candidatus Adiutrix intracellularis]